MSARPPVPVPVLRTPTAPVATVVPLVPTQQTYDVQGTLALDLGVRVPGPPETPELIRESTRVAHLADREVRAWSATLAQAVVETIAGLRPASQLVRWLTPQVYRDVERRAVLVQRASSARVRNLHPQVRSVHLCRIDERAVEVSVHVRHGGRSRALALRLEHRRQRWVCTVLELV